MMAEAIDWDDSATVSGQPVAPEEAWHVAVAPDDVKVVSLEQLDDMFRLSLVDSETKVWQPGMSEWVSLGVVAGLDEPPAPTKRTHPKPPSPRSAPPPRSLPPPPRSLPPTPQRAPVSALPAASFYPQPLQAVSYAAPIPTLAPIASVRPLVVSHNPYPMPQSGGGFGRFLVGLALVAGVGITLYRNGVLRDAAHSIHQDRLYAQLELRLGGPSFGTPRAVEQDATAEAAASSTLSDANAAPARAASETPVLANVAPTPTPTPARSDLGGTSTPPVVSLESLRTEKGAKAAAPEAAPVVAKSPPASAPIAKAAPIAPVAKAAPIAKAAPPPEPKPKPAAKPAAVEKPAAPSKPESEMTPRERLNAEIARSMSSSPASAKKSTPPSTGLKGSGEYDPLNPKL